jgi:hypothetical protein
VNEFKSIWKRILFRNFKTSAAYRKVDNAAVDQVFTCAERNHSGHWDQTPRFGTTPAAFISHRGGIVVGKVLTFDYEVVSSLVALKGCSIRAKQRPLSDATRLIDRPAALQFLRVFCGICRPTATIFKPPLTMRVQKSRVC